MKSFGCFTVQTVQALFFSFNKKKIYILSSKLIFSAKWKKKKQNTKEKNQGRHREKKEILEKTKAHKKHQDSL